MGTVTSIRRRPATPKAAPAFAGIPLEAREAFASLNAKHHALARIFSGSFTTTAQLSEIKRLTGEITVEARLVRDLCR